MAAAGRRRVLTPIETGNPEEGDRKRQREGRLRRTGAPAVVVGVWRSKAVANVRDGRRKLPYGARVPALPVTPGWKEMPEGNDRGDRKRIRRRPPREGEAAQGRVGKVGGGRFPGVLRVEDVGTNIEQLLSKPSGGQGLMNGGRGSVINGTSIDSTQGGVGLGGTGAEDTFVQRSTKTRFHHEAGQGKTTTQGGERRPYGILFEDNEGVTLETLYTVFPVPGSAAGSGGDCGLGATSPPNGTSSGRSSYGSLSSREREALSSVGSDSEEKVLSSSSSVAAGSIEGEIGGGGGGGARGDAPNGEEVGYQQAVFGVKLPTRQYLPVAHRHPELFEYASGRESSPQSSLSQTEEEDEEEKGAALYRLIAALLPLPLKPVPRADADIASREASALALGSAVSPPRVLSCDSNPASVAAQRVGDVRRNAATALVAGVMQAAVDSLVASSRGDIVSTDCCKAYGDAATAAVARINAEFCEAPPITLDNAATPPSVPCCGFSPLAAAAQRAGDADSHRFAGSVFQR